MSKDRLLTVPEVAERLNVSIRWVRNQVFFGTIENIKIGRLVRIRESEVERILAEGTRERASS
jgi:excisionase family DNA binding protein